MKRNQSSWWLGLCVVGLLGLAGCNRPLLSHNGPGYRGRPHGTALAHREPAKLPDSQVAKKPSGEPAAGTLARADAEGADPAPMPPDEISETGGVEPAAPAKEESFHTVAADTPPPAEPIRQAEATAEGSFGHAEDYSWLTGQVEYSWLSKGWRIRYTTLGDPDQYGGSLTLIDDGRFHTLEDGDFVRVQGYVEQSKTPSKPPRFRVLEMKRLGDVKGLEDLEDEDEFK